MKATFERLHAIGAERWYGLDLGEWLAEIGQTGVVSPATWTLVAADEPTEELDIDDQAELNDDDEESGDRTRVLIRFVDEREEEIDYFATVTWVTEPSGDVDKRTIRIRCRER